LGEYFDALAAAASTDQNVLLELVASNTRLTKANEALQASITLLTKNNEALVAKLAQSGIANTANPVKAKKLCPHCKRLVAHLPDDCFELEKNKGRGAVRVGLVCCDGVGYLLGIIETLVRVIKKLVLILLPRCLYPVVADPPSTLLVSI